MSTRKSTLKFHPLADIFPLMEGAEFDALAADIKANGQHARIVLKDGMILDGRNRYRACLAAGIEPSFACREYSDQITDPAIYVISANIRRRHLTTKQKGDPVARLLAVDPRKSDRQIAKTVKASPTFVGKIRAKGEATGDVSTVDTRTDTKGRQQPAKKGRPVTDTGPSEEAGVAEPEEIKSNLLDSIDREVAVVKTYIKILEVSAISTLDEASKDEVSTAIDRVITKWQSLKRVFELWRSPPWGRKQRRENHVNHVQHANRPQTQGAGRKGRRR